MWFAVLGRCFCFCFVFFFFVRGVVVLVVVFFLSSDFQRVDPNHFESPHPKNKLKLQRRLARPLLLPHSRIRYNFGPPCLAIAEANS